MKMIQLWIAAFIATLFPSLALGQAWTLTPSKWSAHTHNTTRNAAQLGYYQITSGGNACTFKTWTGSGETEPQGGQYNAQGATPGYIVVAHNQGVWPTNTADGTLFGGTGGSPASYTGTVTMSMDVMFAIANNDQASFAGTNGANIGQLLIGTFGSGAYGCTFTIANHTGVNYKQKCGIRILGAPAQSIDSGVQQLTGFADAVTNEPMLEFGKVYTITVQVGAGSGTSGWYRVWVDKTLVTSRSGISTNASLGASGNSTVLLSSVGATGVELRALPRASVWTTSGWYDGLVRPTPATNTGTTRVWHTSFTPKDSSGAADITGFPFTITQTSGTTTFAATAFNSSGITPGRLRLVPTGGAGNVFTLASADELGSLETDSYGNQWVGWANEYVPTGSVVWGVQSAGGSDYSIAVNFSNGILREGSTVGSGTVLFALDPNKRYGIVFCGNTTSGRAQITTINLTDEYRRAPLLQTAVLATAWPTSKGRMAATYTLGATVCQPSTMIAGRTWGLVAGDSFGTTYTAALGSITIHVTGSSTDSPSGTLTETSSGATGTITAETVTSGTGTITATITGGSPFQGGGALTYGGGGTGTGSSLGFTLAGALVATRNNVGQHIANGMDHHFIPTGWRPSKPVNTSIPDVTYQWSIGRSGLRIEDMGSTIDRLASLKGVCVFVPCFAVNSATGGSATITADTATTKLSTWGTYARRFRDNALADVSNVLLWVSPLYNHTATNQYGYVGMETFLSGCYQELVADSPTMGIAKGQFWTYNAYARSYPYFVGGDGLHVSGDTEGARLLVSDIFGNPASTGFGSGNLRRSRPRRRRPTGTLHNSLRRAA